MDNETYGDPLSIEVMKGHVPVAEFKTAGGEKLRLLAGTDYSGPDA